MQFIDMKVGSHMYSWTIVRSTIFLIISIILSTFSAKVYFMYPKRTLLSLELEAYLIGENIHYLNGEK